jgi:hypothetical protein
MGIELYVLPLCPKEGGTLEKTRFSVSVSTLRNRISNKAVDIKKIGNKSKT